MKKQYIKPQSTDVTALLGADILEGTAIGGQSRNPVGPTDPNPDPEPDVDWSAKENQGALWDTNLWDDNDENDL